MDFAAQALIAVLAFAGGLGVLGWVRRSGGRGVADWLRGVLGVETAVRESISYGDAISYFETHTLADDSIRKGAMILAKREDGFAFTQVFLNDQDGLVVDRQGRPQGRRLIVQTVDDRLAQLFDGKSVVLVPGVSRRLDSQPPCELLRYRDALLYFADPSPDTPQFHTGAMLLRSNGSGYLFQQVFLDEHGEMICKPGGQPYGRQLQVGAIDEELQEVFRGKTVVLVVQGLPEVADNLLQKQGTEADAGRVPASPAPKTNGKAEGLSSVVGLRNRVRPTENIALLTLRDVVDYFVTHRPRDERVCKGALVVSGAKGKQTVDQLFLDARNEPVDDFDGGSYGRRLCVQRFDSELTEILRDKQVLLFE